MAGGDADLAMTMLHFEREGSGPPLTLVHGFTQTRRCWGQVGTDLARDHTVTRVDAAGHGRSAKVRAGLLTGARLIADCGGRGTYLGYSMGGRLCLHLALLNPELVTGLVVLGATAGIDDAAERRQRWEMDQALADRIELLGVPEFLQQWMANPMFAGLDESSGHLYERMENDATGLAESLRQTGTGSQDPMWDKLARLEMPVLVLAGEHDQKFVDLGRRMVEAIGSNASFVAVPEAGHAAHLERPGHFLNAVRPWLQQHDL